MNEMTQKNSFSFCHRFFFLAEVYHHLLYQVENVSYRRVRFLSYWRHCEEVDVLPFLLDDAVPFLPSSMGLPIHQVACWVLGLVYSRMDMLHCLHLHANLAEILGVLDVFLEEEKESNFCLLIPYLGLPYPLVVPVEDIFLQEHALALPPYAGNLPGEEVQLADDL